MNPLDENPGARRVLYFVQWVYNGLAALLGAFFTVNQTPLEDLPHWYVIALGVAPVLWTYLGLTAQKNVTDSVDMPAAAVEVHDEEPHEVPQDDPEADEEPDDADVDPEDRVDLSDDDHAGD